MNMNISMLDHLEHYPHSDVTEMMMRYLTNSIDRFDSTLLDLALEINAGVMLMILGQFSCICNQLYCR